MDLLEQHNDVLKRFSATNVEIIETPSGARVWHLEVAGEVAFDAWRQLRDIDSSPRLCPVIIGEELPWSSSYFLDDDEPDGNEQTPGFAEIVSAAEDMPFDRWVARERDPRHHAARWTRKAEEAMQIPGADDYVQFCQDMANRYMTNPPHYKPADEYAWPEPEFAKTTDVPSSTLTFDDDYNHVPLDQCGILLCPAEEPWHVPAHLLYAMNGESDDLLEEHALHVAAVRWLGDQFGVELIGICDRTIDFLPGKPPRNRLEAMELAVLVRTYANSPSTANANIDVPDFAVYLLQSRIWSFSWRC